MRKRKNLSHRGLEKGKYTQVDKSSKEFLTSRKYVQTRGGQLAGRCKVGRRLGEKGVENLIVGATIFTESLRSQILTEISQRAICSTPSLVSDEKIQFVNTQVVGPR